MDWTEKGGGTRVMLSINVTSDVLTFLTFYFAFCVFLTFLPFMAPYPACRGVIYGRYGSINGKKGKPLFPLELTSLGGGLGAASPHCEAQRAATHAILRNNGTTELRNNGTMGVI